MVRVIKSSAVRKSSAYYKIKDNQYTLELSNLTRKFLHGLSRDNPTLKYITNEKQSQQKQSYLYNSHDSGEG